MNDFNQRLFELQNRSRLFVLSTGLCGVAFGLTLSQIQISEYVYLSRLLSHPLTLIQISLIVVGALYAFLWKKLIFRYFDLIEKNILDQENINEFTGRLVVEIKAQLSPLVYITWVLPVSGFIGTVIGVSDAIAPLGELLNSDGIESDAISSVLSGLSVAFDTTLVGLIGTVPMMALQMISELEINRKVADLWGKLD